MFNRDFVEVFLILFFCKVGGIYGVLFKKGIFLGLVCIKVDLLLGFEVCIGLVLFFVFLVCLVKFLLLYFVFLEVDTLVFIFFDIDMYCLSGMSIGSDFELDDLFLLFNFCGILVFLLVRDIIFVILVG